MILILLLLLLMMMILMMMITTTTIIIIMGFDLGCTLSAGNSPLSALTKVKKLLLTSMDPQYEMPWKFM